MCHPASFIVTKFKVFWSKKTDSHEEIAREFKLCLDGLADPNGVRVEITPPEKQGQPDFSADLTEWVFKTDQNSVPDWYDSLEVEQRVRAELLSWVTAKVFLSGHHEVTEGLVYLCGSSSAELNGSSSAVLYGSSSAELRDSSSAVLYDSSSAKLYGSSSAVLYGSSSAELNGSSSAKLYGSSSAELYGSSSAVLYGSSSAVLYGSSSAVLYDSSSAVLYGGLVRTWSSGGLKLRGEKSVVVDMRGAKAVCYVGTSRMCTLKMKRPS